MMAETWLWPAVVTALALALGGWQAVRIVNDADLRRMKVPGNVVLSILCLAAMLIGVLVAWLAWAIVA